jgi:molybdenum cofactor guanylyltransferase
LSNNKDLIDGLILCGGQAQRMGGDDKGLIPLGNKTLVTHSIEKLAPQVGNIILNANRNLEKYQALGYPVYSDTYAGYVGPLAGFHVGLSQATAKYLAIIPCDTPLFPDDLIQKLFHALESKHADLSYAVTYNAQQQKQTHPVFCLMRNGLKDHLRVFLESGQRKIDRWFAQLNYAEVSFAKEEAFSNINTPEELAQIERMLHR